MSIDPKHLLDPKYASERADALASCAPAIRQFSSFYPKEGMAVETLIMEQLWLSDPDMDDSAAEMTKQITDQTAFAKSNLTPVQRAAKLAGICLYQRRLAQLEGSPLIAGAVDGSLTPLSIGGAAPPWKQQGKDARIIASNGKSAMHCVTLEQIAAHDSSVSGGMRRLVNNCTDEVEINWCNSPANCEKEQGSTWTVQPGYSWPVSAEGELRWSACHGRDTASTVRGSYGLRYYCTAPLVKSKP